MMNYTEFDHGLDSYWASDQFSLNNTYKFTSDYGCNNAVHDHFNCLYDNKFTLAVLAMYKHVGPQYWEKG